MELAQLKNSRAARRPIITRLIQELRQAITDEDRGEVESCLAKLIAKEVTLLQVNEQLEVASPAADVAAEVTSNDTFNDLIIDAKVAANRFLKSNVATAPAVRSVKSAKLPKLQIPKFNGTLADWERFADQFSAGIDKNPDLSKVDKFNYLKGLLKESASLTIAGLSLTEANYDYALKLLEEKYGDKQLLVAEHVRLLWALKPVARMDNIVELRLLIEDFQKHLRSLEVLGQDVSTMGSLLCPILLRCLPNPIVREWHRQNKGMPVYDLQLLVDFVKDELKGLELTYSAAHLKEGAHAQNASRKGEVSRALTMPSTSLLVTEGSTGTKGGHMQPSKPYCVFCNEGGLHSSAACPKTVTNQERRMALSTSRRCFRCLKKTNHFASTCDQRVNCRMCRAVTHNTVFCHKRNSPSVALASSRNMPDMSEVPARATSRMRAPSQEVDTLATDTSHSAVMASASLSRGNKDKTVSVLQTLRVWVQHEGGMEEIVLLVDSASERSFISTRLVERLRLPVSGEEETVIHSFGGGKRQQRSKIISFLLCGSNGVQVKLSALQVPEICHGVKIWESGLIERFLQDYQARSWNQKMGPGQVASVDVLIGADQYWKVITGQMKKLSTTLMAVNSVFGWMLHGCTPMYSPNATTVSMCVATTADEKTEWPVGISKFWELDSSGTLAEEERSKQTLQEVEVWEAFRRTTTLQDNRYQVNIPWNEKKNELSDNFEVALERLRRLQWKLRQNPAMFERYKSTLFEYLEKGHAEEVRLEEHSPTVYYMPHHAIIKEDRKTTKCRIVFDASSKPEEGRSLNDCQHAGPSLNPPIFDLLLRFRWPKIGITADLSKAFLQVRLNPKDRDATRFLWTDEPWKKGTKPPLRVLRMTSVLFGMKASPFLLAATIRLHASTHPSSNRELGQLLDLHTYVDDHLSGEDTTAAAHKTSTEVYELMLKGGMQFMKWATNDEKLRKLWIGDGRTSVDEPVEEMVKVLGLTWNTTADSLSLRSSALLEASQSEVSTKRHILEMLARVFDPLGFLAPFVILLKCLLQDLWRLKVKWDEEMPENLRVVWLQWKQDLQQLARLEIPRWLQVSTLPGFQLHTFCDAGPRVYAAVVYFRYAVGNPQKFNTCFVTAKSRLAPLQPMSIPRLELMACLIGSRLTESVAQVLSLSNTLRFYWSDSMVALKWIEDVPSRWKLFVARRVQEIQALTRERGTWNYCSSKRNIADIITRGQRLPNLLCNEEWWHGPSWLSLPEVAWTEVEPALKEAERTDLSSEEQIVPIVIQVVVEMTPLLEAEKFSSWQRLTRITAWILRFCTNCRNKNGKRVTWLSHPEIVAAEKYWIYVIQAQIFGPEKKSLLANKELSKDSSIAQFKPFLDAEKLIRLGGRLEFTSFSEAQKHPLLLKGGGLVDLLIQDRHIQAMHGGVQSTLALLRKDVWILRGRQAVRKVVYGCMKCRRWNAKPASEDEAPLPAERVTEVVPFLHCGLDFAGPVSVRAQEGVTQAYICLFTCAVTRAVHLELVASQSAANFILAFRRFVARRGGCRVIFSDNAQTFKKVDRLLRESYAWLRNTQVQEVATQLGIEWKMIPPRAAWWGGMYERMVQVIKYHLRRTLGSALLSSDEFYTVLTEVESVVNNRPLAPLTEDFSDEEYLSPAHFLLGRRGGCLTDSLLHTADIPTNPQLLRRWRYRGQLMSRFWKQWRRHYLLQLRTAHEVQRGSKQQEPVQLNDVVLKMEEKLPRGRWKLARVIELTKGRDGKVRSVMLRHADGSLARRAVQHVCPLEVL